MTTVFPGALDSYADKVDGVDDVMAAHVNDMQDAIEAIELHFQTKGMMTRVRNTSGATVAANDIGYIDEAGEFKTTTVAYLDAPWCVVISGAANNSDIIICRRGRVTVVLNGNCSAGDYLYTSTSTGQAQPQSYMRATVFAVALTANTGGATGTCEALLMTGTSIVSTRLIYDIYSFASASDSDFVSTIATLPGGAVLTYGAVGSGDERNLVPISTNQFAKMRLFNSTRSTYVLISNCVTGTNTITHTANVDAGWQVGDTITIRSQTCDISIGTSFYVDFEFVGGLAAEARSMATLVAYKDTGAAGVEYRIHPWTTGVVSKQDAYNNQVANVWFNIHSGHAPIIQRRFCLLWTSSGVGTITAVLRLQEEAKAIP